MPETITKTYELISVKGVKGWVRDSWARRAILALQTALAGKQDTLSQAQLDAVNSGITATQLQSILNRLHALDGQ